MSRSIVPIPLYDRIGFTGTRQGMTIGQRQLFRRLAETFLGIGVEFHHGCCEGADMDAHAEALRVVGTRIIGHPSKLQSFDEQVLESYACLEEPLNPLDRNRVIVDRVQWMIAAPKEDFSKKGQLTLYEVQRSGTWMTMRYSKTERRMLTIIWPNGTLVTYHYI